MATVKAKDLRGESEEELDARLITLKREILKLRSEQLENKTKQTHLIGQKRKEAARILTVKREKKVST